MDKELKNKIDFINQRTGKKTGFSTPENYFEEMEDNFFTTITIENLPKEEILKTPENYFNTVEDTILTKLNIVTPKKGKVISINTHTENNLQIGLQNYYGY